MIDEPPLYAYDQTLAYMYISVPSSNLPSVARACMESPAQYRGSVLCSYLRHWMLPIYTTKSFRIFIARLAQSVERETLNLKVAGSTPASGSIPDASLQEI
ncbi:hypothetical protein GGR54DRAFT_362089 [Hypoxylon sp. NC1633]|nr:hypothetical protein GGR54DRAFT_362089 [Hypoxylon sp. NC1633]